MYRILLNLMLSTLIGTTSIDAGEVDPICVAKVKFVAHAASQEAASRMNDIEFVFHKQSREIDSTHKQPEGASKSDWNISLSLAKKRWLIDSRYLGRGTDVVGVMNEDYTFAVSPTNDNRQNRFKLAGAIKNDDDNSKVPSKARFENVQNILEASYALHGLSWHQLLTSPDYRVVVAKFVGEGTDEDRPIRLEVQSLVGNTKGFRYWSELGQGPGTSLMIKRCGFRNPAGHECTRDIEYQPYGQSAFPKTIATTIKIPQYMNVETLTIETPHPCTRPDAEFYLPYYGIPESVVDVTRTNSWVRTAAIVLSLIGVVVSIYFYRLSRKPSVTKATLG